MRDYYKILEVSPLSSQEEIKQAYRKLALKFHPDVNSTSEDKFLEISEAYRILGKESSRRNYDFLIKYATFLLTRHRHQATSTSKIQAETHRSKSVYDVFMFVLLLGIALLSFYFSVTDCITQRFEGLTSLSGM